MATLVDGRMPPAEEERAWAHVHGCLLCSEAVQHEGWVKRQLAGLSYTGAEPVPAELVGTLCDPTVLAAGAIGTATDPLDPSTGRPRRLAGLALLGAGSVSAAMMGVVAFGAAPANAPGLERLPSVLPQPVAALTASPRPRLGRADDDAALDPGQAARRFVTTVSAVMSAGG